MKKAGLAVLAAASLAVSMPQANGTIAGRILHADGTPAIGVRVVAMEVGTPEATEPVLIKFLSKISRTDSAGKFRFDSVRPGSYFVAAGAEYYAQAGTAPGRSGFTIYPPNYFSGVADIARATAITVRSSATFETEFRLAPPATPAPSPSFKVSGRVLGDLTRFRTSAEGYFAVGFRPSPARLSASVAPDGAFELRGVAPGSYMVSLAFWASDAGRMVLPTTTIDVTDKDIPDLTFDVEGRSVTVGGRPAQAVPQTPFTR